MSNVLSLILNSFIFFANKCSTSLILENCPSSHSTFLTCNKLPGDSKTTKLIMCPQAVSICLWWVRGTSYSVTSHVLVFLQYLPTVTAKWKETVLPLPWAFASLAINDGFLSYSLHNLTDLNFCNYLIIFFSQYQCSYLLLTFPKIIYSH